MHRPLEGIRVVELSTMITASFAAMMMAEQGATVVKVEPVDVGDPMRYLGTSKNGISGLFVSCNRGKASIRVNLKDAKGQEIVQRLMERADVVLHNFRPGVMESLELGSEAMRARNPRLVYIAITGFGTKGPLRDAPAYDPIVQARAGFAAVQGTTEPVFVRNLVCDKITAYTACQAATAALLVRARTGRGQHIDISML
jgi:crotonobetainyl-CoA:carnitine CoA-transferase CaiB-like acyl-CoA transferase